jgi:hypothetical protein
MRVLQGEFHEGNHITVDVGENGLVFEKAGTRQPAAGTRR